MGHDGPDAPYSEDVVVISRLEIGCSAEVQSQKLHTILRQLTCSPTLRLSDGKSDKMPMDVTNGVETGSTISESQSSE
jgi:hypothetical protein